MRILFYTIWAILLAILQPTLIQWIAVFGIAPNAFLVFVILAGYLRGRTEGAVAGLIFGMVYDLLIGKLMGVNALLFMYVGFGAGILSEKFFGDSNVWMIAVTVMVAALATGVLYWMIAGMVYGPISFYTGFVKTIIPESIYNAVICVPLFFLVRATALLLKKKTAY